MTARYMPFGTFAHVCPGKRFSHNWIKMVIVEFFEQFEAEIEGPVPALMEGIMPVLGDHAGMCTIRYRARGPEAALSASSSGSQASAAAAAGCPHFETAG